MIKADLHVHTEYSSDGLMTLERLAKLCERRGLNCIAVTDHNAIEGAKRFAAMTAGLDYPLKVVIGEEIRSAQGEVIGLFLTDEIPRDLSMEETIGRIREQNGLVYLPHPCDRLRRSKVHSDILRNILPLCDIIETFNARNVFAQDNLEAEKLAEEFDLVQGIGSDAHTWMELGNCYMEMEDFTGRDDFLEKLRTGVRVMKKSSLVVHGITKTMKAWNKLGGAGSR